MELDDVFEIWNPARLSDVLDTTVQNVSMWRKTGIPLQRQYEIQVKSKGRLLASGFDPERDYVSNGLVQKYRGRKS